MKNIAAEFFPGDRMSDTNFLLQNLPLSSEFKKHGKKGGFFLTGVKMKDKVFSLA
jgi:hypothetical protein